MLTLVMGGQYGGEGKGNVFATLAHHCHPAMLVKTGGPNSSHSYESHGRRWRLRALPAGANFFDGQAVYPAGSLIHVPTLFRELEEVQFSGSLLIDPHAGIVTESHVAAQHAEGRYARLGSTRTGTGAASADRSLRKLGLAKDCTDLSSYLVDTLPLLAEMSMRRELALIEGSQAFGLSNYHGSYPYVTSRDTTAAGLLAQLGVAPRALNVCILVLKCFPTRNKEGNGPLHGEDALRSQVTENRVFSDELGGGSYAGGDLPRRVGLFDWQLALRAVQSTGPDYLAITGLDRLSTLEGSPLISDWYGSATEFVDSLEGRLDTTVGAKGWGPAIEDIEVMPELLRVLGGT